jgi:hypothetical protein
MSPNTVRACRSPARTVTSLTSPSTGGPSTSSVPAQGERVVEALYPLEIQESLLCRAQRHQRERARVRCPPKVSSRSRTWRPDLQRVGVLAGAAEARRARAGTTRTVGGRRRLGRAVGHQLDADEPGAAHVADQRVAAASSLKPARRYCPTRCLPTIFALDRPSPPCRRPSRPGCRRRWRHSRPNAPAPRGAPSILRAGAAPSLAHGHDVTTPWRSPQRDAPRRR